MPEISVIIPCYNQEKYIAEYLDSVLAQTFKDYEIIVVNDGSTDNSEEIIRRYMESYPQIKLINQPNQGVVAARNNAVNDAKSQYIYPLDADDVIADMMLEKSYAAISQGKGDIITTRVLKFGEESGKMELLPPLAENLIKANCLVNAALLRKKRFSQNRRI